MLLASARCASTLRAVLRVLRLARTDAMSAPTAPIVVGNVTQNSGPSEHPDAAGPTLNTLRRP